MDGMTKQTPGSLLLVATIAGGIAFVAFVALMVVGGFTVSPAAFLAIVVALAAAIFLFQGFHKSSATDRPQSGRVDQSVKSSATLEPGSAGVTPGSAGVAPGTAGTTPTGTVTDSSVDRPLGADATGDMAGAAPRADLGGMPDTEAGGPARKEPDLAAAPAAPAEEESEAKWRSSQLSGTQELAERRGTWRYEPEGAAHAGTGPDLANTAPDGPAETGAGPAANGSAEAGTGPMEVAPAPGSDHTTGPHAAELQPGPEEREAGEAAIGTEPARLEAPRDGTPDELRRISGIGPKIEEMLHRLGIYHFDQIAGWSEQEAAWIDERLEGFRGRVRRDEWVRQARDMAGQG